ncbi:aminotransferase class V-fold PLP-dependent enzyme [Dactylosporangium matsuzakiense]|uniref:Aminotransferase class V n=1 Tax=Dactylosporangium matsuzakiense TaxID=53360 RepID=A0A9W6KSV0_9ACTN|nr:aminotransferase class V-fold PLP-dependent enzyme [Dactylosporangium matsuzakiense]UWZ49794.1 aminotransferase class V-fold PLP-dependent enzyme [Dactylosporangium matsuzakiense]GLL06983.1 aminotransferase class V [Dactylosporangium matsuzakiense]
MWDPEPGWLNTASYGLPPRRAFEELQAMLADWRVGRTSWEGWDIATQRSRESFARLIGVAAEDVCVGAQVSQVLAPVAAGLAGNRFLVPDVEFTSNLFPWLATAQVRTVPAASLADSVDSTVDVVAFSLVQSADGAVADYAAVVAAARAHGALVVVDATQACGWLPFDGSLADVVAAGAYKWLMSPRGSAFAYLAPHVRERFLPVAAGWYAGEDVHGSYYGEPLRLASSARRFDISPSWPVYSGTAPALEVVEEIGVAAINAHNVQLANRFRAGLGLPPGDSAIAVVDVPGAEELLRRAGVRAAVRAGRVRASFHIYTTDADVDLALNALTHG